VGCFQIPFSALVRESLGTVLIPRLSALKARGDTAEMRRLLAAATSRLALVNCGLVGLMASFGEDTIRLLFSDRYRASWPVFAVNLMYLLIEIPITDPAGRAYPEIMRKTLHLRLLTAPLSTLVMAWFAWRGGLVCVVAVAVGVILIEKACACWWVARAIGFPAAERSRWRALPAAAAIGLGAAAAGAGARGLLSGSHLLLRLAAAGAVFGCLYGWTIWKSGLVPEQDKTRVLNLAARLRLRRPPRTPVG
jgi:O-antigen/teichoic acid export membrane protein